MSKDYTQKIRNILNQSTQTVPYVFERFYTALKRITQSMKNQNIDQKVFEQYSLIFRTVKKYIKDEPFSLLNNLEKIQKELKNLLHPLLIQIQDDLLSKKILEYFSEKEANKTITTFINEADKLRQQLVVKNLKVKVFGTHQMSNAFWIKKFKNQYSVHIDLFWESFMEFIQEINFFEYFISSSSKRSIIKIVDSSKKFFVTSSNVCQLFYKLSEPDFLEKLADQTAKGTKSSNFSSKDFLQLQFYPTLESLFQTNLIEGSLFEVSGQDTLIEGKRNICKHVPTIIFGSSADCDIKIKNKYVSRKQFMIIEEDEQNPSVHSKNLPFSLVCLSSSNFTMVTYDRQQRLRMGMIFKIEDNSIQVLSKSNTFKQSQKSIKSQSSESLNEDQDQTLEYLPTKSTHQISDQVQLEYIFLTGEFKGQKGKLTKKNLKIKQIQSSIIIQYKQNDFFIQKQVKIYIKTANQVINGELSNKISLQEGMKIFLQECYFDVK